MVALRHVVPTGQSLVLDLLDFASVLDDGLKIFCHNNQVSATRFPAFFSRTRTPLERGEIHVAMPTYSSLSL